MVEKVTMKLKVNGQCEKCYTKVKKLLAKYPQIRDQKFDEKENIVTITVECCSPEKLRDKLCCKGGCCIISIEIVEPPPPPPPPPSTPSPEDKPKPEPPCVNVYVGPLVCLCHNGYYGRPVYDCGSGGRPNCVSHCSQYEYFCEENASGCTIM